MLLAKTKLNTFEILISMTLISSYSNHDELISVKVLRIYKEIKEEIKNPEDTVICTILQQWKCIVLINIVANLKISPKESFEINVDEFNSPALKSSQYLQISSK